MITIKISKDQIERAKKRYSFGTLKNSITKGKSNIYGALGEILIKDYFYKRKVTDISTYDYDLIIDEYEVEVKTKRTTVYPKPNYTCSVTGKQKCDYYFFVRILEDLSIGYLLGYIDAETFYKTCPFRKRGELDESGFAFRADGYHIQIKELYKFK